MLRVLGSFEVVGGSILGELVRGGHTEACSSRKKRTGFTYYSISSNQETISGDSS
ncbi:MAG: hypothetical protein AAF587_42605 [Bacteroidota bacterium]